MVLFISTGCGDKKGPPSVCYGTPGKGRLEHGQYLPLEGENFSSYSLWGSLLGRTAVHSRVKEIILAAYEKLDSVLPEKVFVYGETGWKSGGRFILHRTHQNGLSVDFMVPVVNQAGESVPLPTHVFNKWGYGINFDSSGNFKDYRIDFEAVAAHLFYLDQMAKARGAGIQRVIFYPEFIRQLELSPHWPYLSQNMSFSKKPAWVKHDDHYHVDFDVPCEPL